MYRWYNYGACIKIQSFCFETCYSGGVTTGMRDGVQRLSPFSFLFLSYFFHNFRWSLLPILHIIYKLMSLSRTEDSFNIFVLESHVYTVIISNSLVCSIYLSENHLVLVTETRNKLIRYEIQVQ